MNPLETLQKLKENLVLIDMLFYTMLKDEEIQQLYQTFGKEMDVLKIIQLELSQQREDDIFHFFIKNHLPSYTILKNKLFKKEMEFFDNLSA